MYSFARAVGYKDLNEFASCLFWKHSPKDITEESGATWSIWYLFQPTIYMASQVAEWLRTCLPMQETQETRVWPLGQKDPLEKKTTTHPSLLAWEIPWTEKPGRLQSMGSQRVKHNWATKIFTHSLHRVDSKEIIKMKCLKRVRHDCSDLACMQTL